MPSQPPDSAAALLRRAAARDEAAARALVDQLGPLVRRIICSHEALRMEADDLTQDVFFRIFRSAQNYRADAPLEHWVARLAKFTCIDRLRRLRARPEVRLSDLSPKQQSLLAGDGAAGESSPAKGEDAAALLARLFATLAPADAWLLREVELAERPPADVAAEAGWSTTLTRVRLFRARKRLRAAYEKLFTP